MHAKPRKKAPMAPAVKATVISRADKARQEEKALIRRHQAALRVIDKLDAQRIAHPHIPELANNVLRMDDVMDLPPVIETICEQAGPLPEDMRLPEQIPGSLFGPPASDHREIIAISLSALAIVAAILVAAWLASGAQS